MHHKHQRINAAINPMIDGIVIVKVEESEVEDEKNGKKVGIGEGQDNSWFPRITFASALFRGVQVFSPAPAFPLVTVWDLVALLRD